MWQAETQEVKASFKKKSDEQKQRLLQEHPGWKCSPRKSSEIKKRNKHALRKQKKFSSTEIDQSEVPATTTGSLEGPQSQVNKMPENSAKHGASTPSVDWSDEVHGMTGAPERYDLLGLGPSTRDRAFAATLPLMPRDMAIKLGYHKPGPEDKQQAEEKERDDFDNFMQGLLS